MDVIDRRLKALETQNRLLKMLVVVVLAFGVLSQLVPVRAQSDVITASQIRIVNGGKTVVSIGGTADGGYIDVSSRNGGVVAEMNAKSDGYGRVVAGLEGTPYAAVGADTSGGYVQVANPDKAIVAIMDVNTNTKAGALSVSGADGKTIVGKLPN